MNATEIAEAIEILAEQPFNAAEFPYAFLEAFGRKPTEIKRLRSGNTNKSDVGGGISVEEARDALGLPGPGARHFGSRMRTYVSWPTTSPGEGLVSLANTDENDPVCACRIPANS